MLNQGYKVGNEGYCHLSEAQVDDNCRKAAMRAFFAVARECGLDVCSKESRHRMRAAISEWLGRWVYSRRELSGGEWCEVRAAVELGLIAW